MSTPMTGELVRVGTMNVSGEELTGYFVQTTVEELRAVRRLPIYRRVEIREIAEADPTTEAVSAYHTPKVDPNP